MRLLVTGSYTTYHVYENANYINTCKWYLNDNSRNIHSIIVLFDGNDIDVNNSKLLYKIEGVTVFSIKFEYIYIYSTHYVFGYHSCNYEFGTVIDNRNYANEPYSFNEYQNKKICEFVSEITHKCCAKLESCCWNFGIGGFDIRNYIENLE
jgi:hypothetical protein